MDTIKDGARRGAAAASRAVDSPTGRKVRRDVFLMLALVSAILWLLDVVTGAPDVERLDHFVHALLFAYFAYPQGEIDRAQNARIARLERVTLGLAREHVDLEARHQAEVLRRRGMSAEQGRKGA